MYFNAPESSAKRDYLDQLYGRSRQAQQVIKEYQAGIALSSIAQRYKLPYEEVVHIIAKHKEQVQKRAQIVGSKNASVLTSSSASASQNKGMFRKAKGPQKAHLWKESQFKRKVTSKPRTVKGLVALLQKEGKLSASPKEMEAAFSVLIPQLQAGRMNAYQAAKVLRSSKVKDLLAKKRKLAQSGATVGPIKMAQLKSQVGPHMKKLKLMEKRKRIMERQRALLAAKHQQDLAEQTQAQLQTLQSEMAALRALIDSHMSSQSPQTQIAMEDAVAVALAEAGVEEEAESIPTLTKEDLAAMAATGEDVVAVADNQIAALLEEVGDSVQDARPVVMAQKSPMKIFTPLNLGLAAGVGALIYWFGFRR